MEEWRDIVKYEFLQLMKLLQFNQISKDDSFVEKNTSLPKSELIGRMAGHVKFEFLQLMKLLQFNQISKDDSGHLSLF
jgi:hypothetical protein